MSLEAAAAGLLLRNLQDQFIRLCGRSPHEPDPAPIGARAQDLHGLPVHAPRRLGSRTREVMKIPQLAIQIQEGAGRRSTAVRFDPVQSEHLAFSVRFDPYGEAFAAGIGANRRASPVNSPGPEGWVGPAGHREEQDERCGAPVYTVREIQLESQSRRVVTGCYTFARP